MKKLLMTKIGIVFLFSFMLASCSVESDVDDNFINADGSEESPESEELDLPKCTSQLEGVTVGLVEDEASYKCENGKWNRIESKGKKEEAVSSSSAKRKRDEWDDEDDSSSSSKKKRSSSSEQEYATNSSSSRSTAKSSASGKAKLIYLTYFDNIVEDADVPYYKSRAVKKTIENCTNMEYYTISEGGSDGTLPQSYNGVNSVGPVYRSESDWNVKIGDYLGDVYTVAEWVKLDSYWNGYGMGFVGGVGGPARLDPSLDFVMLGYAWDDYYKLIDWDNTVLYEGGELKPHENLTYEIILSRPRNEGWHHYAMVVDNKNFWLKVYRDGALVVRAKLKEQMPFFEDLFRGSSDETSQRMTEFVIYSGDNSNGDTYPVPTQPLKKKYEGSQTTGELDILSNGLGSRVSGDVVRFKGVFSLDFTGISDENLDKVAFTGLSFKVAKVSAPGNLVSTNVSVDFNPIKLPSTNDIDLNSTFSAGVSIDLRDPGFRTCGEHSLVVTVSATDGTKDFIKTEQIPFERDEEYCQEPKSSSSSTSGRVGCMSGDICSEAPASMASECKEEYGNTLVVACPAGGYVCEIPGQDITVHFYDEDFCDLLIIDSAM